LKCSSVILFLRGVMTYPPVLNRRSKGALDGRAVFVSSNLASERCGLQTTERKRTAACEYQDGSLCYDAHACITQKK